MRRTIMYILVLVMVFSLTGCGSSEKQEELIDYINNDIAELVTLENEMLESYGSVTGDNYSNDIEQKKLIVDERKLVSAGPIKIANQTLVEMALKNLLENAIKYSPEGAIIRLSSCVDSFTIYNSGVKISNEHLEHLGKRFYRPSGHNEKGSGLGLSIVKLIVEHYNCKLTYDNSDDGFIVIISIK